MNYEKIDELFKKLSIVDTITKSPDLNGKEKLELLRQLSEFLKKSSKDISTNSEKYKDLFEYLIKELHKSSSKDPCRKLIARCANLISENKNSIYYKQATSLVLPLFGDNNVTLGQKLFVLNNYLENLDEFGIECISMIKIDCLDHFLSWCLSSLEELKNSNAPITLCNISQNLQWIFRAVIVLLQKCFNTTDVKDKSIEHKLETLRNISLDVLSLKDCHTMDLGHGAAMVYILINSLMSSVSQRAMLENMLKDDNGSNQMRDLCLYQSILTMIKPQLVISENLLDLYEKILINSIKKIDETIDSSYLIAKCRAVNMCTIKLNDYITLDKCVVYNSLFKKNREWLSLLNEFIWSHFDNSIDVVRHTSVESYQKLLNALSTVLEKSEITPILDSELERCMKLSWQNNSKFTTLSALLENGLNATTLIKRDITLPEQLLSSISERSTASSVADLYSKLFKRHREESTTSISIDEWARIWWKPIIKIIESNSKSKKLYIYQYILPRLLKLFPDGMTFCHKFCTNNATIISYAKICRTLGILATYPQDQHNYESNKIYLFGNIDKDILENTVIHDEDEIRLDSLALITENPKTTEAICAVEFSIVKKFLNFNSDNLSPSYRQSLLASIKKFFVRFKESWLLKCRTIAKLQKIKTDDDDEINTFKETQTKFDETHQLYKEFIGWLFEYIFNSIHLDATFGKRNQALLILNTFLDVAGSVCKDDELAAVLFDYQTFMNRKHLFSLIECIWDTYVINKNLGLQLLLKVNSETFEKQNFNFANDFYDIAIKCLKSRRPCDSQTSVYLMMLFKEKAKLKDFSTFYNKNNAPETIGIFLIESVVSELEHHCNTAIKNLLLASLNTPIYGPVSAIRYLMNQSLNEINGPSIKKWKDIIEKIIDLCLKVSEIVSPIVKSDSPEGIFPTELLPLKDGSNYTEEIDHVTPQMLLVCCWRSIKEISLLFGDMIYNLPIELESEPYIISSKQISLINDYFVNIMLTTRHVGAFESAYDGFTRINEKFWRRGGGMPFFVQAVVSSELIEKGRVTLDKCMKTLVPLAEANHSSDDENFSKVLSMYILSALFKDTRIGEEVLKYAEGALIAAINGFDSMYWNVRNASTILFSSLMNRIFGVNRSREEISKKNSMPGKIFFSKFPRLYDYFMNLIKDAIQQMKTHLNAKLYLVLLIFCRLYTLSDEKSDPDALLHTYIPLLLQCSKSPVMKIRVYNAKAIATMVNIERYPNLLTDLFEIYLKNEYLNNTDSNKCIDNNCVNGILELLNCLIDKHPIISLSYVISQMRNYILIDHDCLANYTSLMKLILKISQLEKNDTKSSMLLMDELCDFLLNKFNKIASLTEWNLPGAHDFLRYLSGTYAIVVNYKCKIGQTSNDISKLKQLADNEQQFTYVTNGLIEFFHSYLSNRNIHLDSSETVSRDETNDDSFVQIIDPKFYEIVSLHFKSLIYETISSQKIHNNIYKTSKVCELLVVMLNTERTLDNKQLNLFTYDELHEMWKILLELSMFKTQFEETVRAPIINSLSCLLKSFQSVKYKLDFEKVANVLQNYLDNNDNSIPVANFMLNNSELLDNSVFEMGHVSLIYWNVLIQLLLDVDGPCCRIAISIINGLMIKHLNESANHKYEANATIQIGLRILIKLFYNNYPKETIEFLLNQFEVISECDSSSADEEEEIEIVFDKGVEAINSITEQYCKYLCESLVMLFNEITSLNESLQTQIIGYLQLKYKLIFNRLNQTTRSIFEFYLNEKKLLFNDIKYSFIVCNLMFLKKMLGFVSSEYKNEFYQLVKYMKSKSSLLNCYLQQYI